MILHPMDRATRTLDVPNEPGQTITIRRLAWSELPTRTGSDVTGYMLALFSAAVVSWSYPEDVAGHLAYLDDSTAGWLYLEIDRFVHHADREASQGNAIAPSTASSTGM